MKIQLDPASPFPYYHQIREQLREHISSRLMQPGDPLPGETQICQETGVSRMTARQALCQLAGEGLVVRQRGRGTFVAAPRSDQTKRREAKYRFIPLHVLMGIITDTRLLTQETIPASAEAAAELSISPGESVIRISRLHIADGEIAALEASSFPHSLFPGLGSAEIHVADVFKYLAMQYGIYPAYATDRLEISTAGLYEASILGIDQGSVIVKVLSRICLEDDNPIAFSHTIYRGDRFHPLIRRSFVENRQWTELG